jgi:hypothetical protein
MVTEKVSSDTEPRHSQTIKHEFGGSHGAKASFTARITSSKQRKNTVENLYLLNLVVTSLSKIPHPGTERCGEIPLVVVL